MGPTAGVPLAYPPPNLQSTIDIQPQAGPISSTTKVSSLGPTYSITLVGGFQLQYSEGDLQQYSEGDLQQPRSLHMLISHPDELFLVWDDSSPTWDKNKCPLVIQGV